MVSTGASYNYLILMIALYSFTDYKTFSFVIVKFCSIYFESSSNEIDNFLYFFFGV